MDRDVYREATHLCPPTGETCTPCCGRTPFELPRTDRITLDDDLVTCKGPHDIFFIKKPVRLIAEWGS